MAKTDIDKLRDKIGEDLAKEVLSERKHLQELRFDLARGKVKNSAAVRDARRKIARLETLIKEKSNIRKGIENGGK